MKTWRWLLPLALLTLTGCPDNQQPTQTDTGDEPVVDTGPPVESIEPVAVTVYFADKDLEYLEAEAIDVPVPASDPQAQLEASLRALLAGPTEEAHETVIPAGVKLNEATIADGTATIDLSKSFVDEFNGGSGIAALAVWSVVNTAAEVPGVERVQFEFDGVPGGDFAGVIDLANPIEPDRKLIGSENL